MLGLKDLSLSWWGWIDELESNTLDVDGFPPTAVCIIERVPRNAPKPCLEATLLSIVLNAPENLAECGRCQILSIVAMSDMAIEKGEQEWSILLVDGGECWICIL